MRPALFALCLIMSAATNAVAADDTPLFGSEGSGVIRINMPKRMNEQLSYAVRETNVICASQSCTSLHNAGTREVTNGPQP